MTPGKSRTSGHPLGAAERERTADWLEAQQQSDGSFDWCLGGKYDPWDHLHCAMGLMQMGRFDPALAAFDFLVRTQYPDGAWIAERRDGRITNSGHESNHAAYLATGLWYYYRARQDVDLLAEMWPVLERAIEFVVRLQDETGAISWIVNDGKVWKAPLLTGSSSVHGSLTCAIRVAELLGHDRPRWRRCRERLGRLLRQDLERFWKVDLPEGPGKMSMDWYYPVLGGAVRGEAGRARLLDPVLTDAFLTEGKGVRCVIARPWYTAAETSEFILALDAAGLSARAREVFSWLEPFRTERDAYWTGLGYPEKLPYPENEETTYTAATILMASDALADDSPTSSFFRDLAGEDLDADQPDDVRDEPRVAENISDA